MPKKNNTRFTALKSSHQKRDAMQRKSTRKNSGTIARFFGNQAPKRTRALSFAVLFGVFGASLLAFSSANTFYFEPPSITNAIASQDGISVSFRRGAKNNIAFPASWMPMSESNYRHTVKITCNESAKCGSSSTSSSQYTGTTAGPIKSSFIKCNTRYIIGVQTRYIHDGRFNVVSPEQTRGITTAACQSSSSPAVAPSLSVVGTTANSVTLQWTAGSPGTDGSNLGYTIAQNFSGIGGANASTRRFTHTGLQCNTSYLRYSVSLVYAQGKSAQSNFVNAMTGPCPSPQPAPAPPAPTQPSPQPTPSQPSPQPAPPQNTTSPSPQPTPSQQPISVAPAPRPSQSRQPRTQLQGGSGNIVQQPQADTSSPTAPSNVRAVSDEDSLAVLISWNASTDTSGIKAYTIERSTDGRDWIMLNDNITVTSYRDEVLVESIYQYRVAAIDQAGNTSVYGFAEYIPASLTATANTTRQSTDRAQLANTEQSGRPLWLTILLIIFSLVAVVGAVLGGLWYRVKMKEKQYQQSIANDYYNQEHGLWR